jgi:hypothetical protein
MSEKLLDLCKWLFATILIDLDEAVFVVFFFLALRPG